jgi:hypothetical protein
VRSVALPCLLLFSLLLAASKAYSFNSNYSDIAYWEQWAIQQGYTISNYVYSEGNSTGIDGEIGNEFVCIRDDSNQLIIGRPDVCGTYYSGLGYGYIDITGDTSVITAAPDIIDNITGNLVDPNLQNWGGCDYTGVNRGGTYPGGPRPNCGQDIINWSYGGYWVYRRHAIEQALKQAGVNVDGYQWEFRIKNLNGNRPDQYGVDTLDIRMIIWDNSGNQVHHKQWVYDWKFDWTTFSGTELFASPLIGENLRDWQIQMYGRDSGYWSGFYGPEMMTPEIRMIYSSNPCVIDPLLHPDCEGYVQAYTTYVYDQNCTANPLYDSGCPGYQQAYETQQCNANPLYSPSCSGYQEAYYDQQCSYNPLYDAGCPGYQQAYYDQQCSTDPLYDSGCPGYETAYYDQQCSADPLYDSGCPGYAQAYYDQQCSVDPLYDAGCNGYAEAFYDQQCGINPLYDSGCPGYEQAYYDQQCSINGLYDAGCPNYATAYFDYQCSIDALYSTECTGYADAYYSLQCSIDALYDTQCPGYADAYYDQQCGLDALYDSGCPGYEQAYYETYIAPGLEAQANEIAGTDSASATNSISTVPTTAEDLVEPSITGDATVDDVLGDSDVTTVTGVPGMGMDATQTDSVETTSAQTGSTSSESTTTADTVATDTTAQEPEESLEAEIDALVEEGPADEDAKEETSSESSEEGSSDSDTGDSKESDGDGNSDSESEDSDSEGGDSTENKSDKKESKKTLSPAESKRQKLIAIATERAMNLANAMSEAASFEAQQAIQRQITALINFVPGFTQYGKVSIPGTDFYADEEIYQDKKIPENQRGLRNGLAQQLLHEKMVEMQYEKINEEQ